MNTEQLKKKLIVDEATIDEGFEKLVDIASKHCVLDLGGRPHLKARKLSGKNKVKVVLAARALASRLDPNFSADLTVDELSAATGLPANQTRARIAEAIDDRFAEQSGRGAYRANLYQLSSFFDELSASGQ